MLFSIENMLLGSSTTNMNFVAIQLLMKVITWTKKHTDRWISKRHSRKILKRTAFFVLLSMTLKFTYNMSSSLIIIIIVIIRRRTRIYIFIAASTIETKHYIIFKYACKNDLTLNSFHGNLSSFFSAKRFKTFFLYVWILFQVLTSHF